LLQLAKVFKRAFSRQLSVVRILVIFLVLAFVFLHSNPYALHPVYADNEFSSSYNITYDVDQTGVTTVTEKITLKNLTDKYYASDFKLSISATKVTEVSMTDSQGPLDVQVNTSGATTNINTQFNQQIAGKGKEYTFSLHFKSTDFAQKMGKIWQVTIPKIAEPGNLNQFNLTLSVPASFGDPTNILPEPVKQTETGSKLNYFFNKDQLSQAGILASFGNVQFFDFSFGYDLKNDGLLPKIIQIPIPTDYRNQKVLINSIEPKPENVVTDFDGNYLASFKVGQRQSVHVQVQGFAKLSPGNDKNMLSKEQKQIYTASQSYWEKDSPQVKTKLAEIFKSNPTTTNEKARLIDQFVASYLQYDENRVKNNDFRRLGALTALNNPQQSLCSEYADVFVTMARSAGIPAREVVGYAYTTNTSIRPLSLQNTYLHAWAQYFDNSAGWVDVDPTWQSTTGGVDYFSQFDLNHLVIGFMGDSSAQPLGPSQVNVTFAEPQDQKPQVNLQIIVPSEIYAGFPVDALVRVENSGNIATSSAKLQFKAQKLSVIGLQDIQTPPIPPFGQLEYDYKLGTQTLSSSFTDHIALTFGKLTTGRDVMVKPFLASRFFAAAVFGVAGFIALFYLGTLLLHHKSPFHELRGKKSN